MKRKEFKETLFEALNNVVDGMSYDDKMILVHNLLVDYEKDNEENGYKKICGLNIVEKSKM